MLLQRAESRSWSCGCRHTHQLDEEASLVTRLLAPPLPRQQCPLRWTDTREGLNTNNGGLNGRALASATDSMQQHVATAAASDLLLFRVARSRGAGARGGGACACAHAFVCVRHSRGLNGNKKVAHRKLRRSPRQGKPRQRCWPSVRSASRAGAQVFSRSRKILLPSFV